MFSWDALFIVNETQLIALIFWSECVARNFIKTIFINFILTVATHMCTYSITVQNQLQFDCEVQATLSVHLPFTAETIVI